MRASVVYSAAFAAVASAQSSSVDPFPQTSLTVLTNSQGVITGQFPLVTSQPGQPAVVTQQPGVVTSQPLPADIPAVGSGVHTLLLPGTGSAFNQTRTVVVSANNSTTVQLVQSPTAASGSARVSGSGSAGASGASGASASRSGSATGAPTQSQGAAAGIKVAGSFVGFGAFVAALL